VEEMGDVWSSGGKWVAVIQSIQYMSALVCKIDNKMDISKLIFNYF